MSERSTDAHPYFTADQLHHLFCLMSSKQHDVNALVEPFVLLGDSPLLSNIHPTKLHQFFESIKELLP